MVQILVTTLLMKTALTPLRVTSDHPHFNTLTLVIQRTMNTLNTEEGDFICLPVLSERVMVV